MAVGFRLRLCRWGIGALLPLLLACGSSPGPSPDVLLVTLDTTRAQNLGPYGYARATTPALDRFAEEAVVYQRAWSTSCWTLPAHASMFTGLHPTSHGAHLNARGGAQLSEVIADSKVATQIRVNRLGEEQVTLAERLAARGYTTAAFAGGPWLAPEFGLLQGYAHRDADTQSFKGRPADVLTDAAAAWLESVPSERRVHLVVNYFDPHHPYAPGPGYDVFPAARDDLSVTPQQVVAGAELSAADRAGYVDRYDGEIRFVDEQLGRLLDVLKRLGRYDGALIIVVADHGESLGEHGLMGHVSWLYEEVLRVPLIVRLPGGRDAGTSVETAVSIVDLLPLVAREVGLELEASVQGVLPGERETAFAEIRRDPLAIRLYGARRFDRDLYAAIRWPWKLVSDGGGALRLYDLARDPAERVVRPDASDVERDLYRALAATRLAWVPPAAASPPDGVSPATRERLHELGYTD